MATAASVRIPLVAALRLHHWGFVAGDLQASAAGFAKSLGATWDGVVYEDPHQGVRVTFLDHGGSPPRIELVEPAGGASPVSRFLTEQGGGLHHVCYEVQDLEAALAEFRERRALMVKSPAPAVAFGGRRIAWVMTREKLLVELLEEGSGG